MYPCNNYLHQACAGFKTHGEASTHKSTFKCNKCKEKQENHNRQQEITDMRKIILGYNGINLCKNDIESIGPGRWFNDTVMSCGIQKILSEYDCNTAKIKLVDSLITQILKHYHKKATLKAIL